MSLYQQGWRYNLHMYLFNVSSKSGRIAETFWMLATLASVACIFIESGVPQVFGTENDAFSLYMWLEYVFTLIFTLEYLLRLLTAPRPLRYAFSFFGLVDLITILPLYIFWLWPDVALKYMVAMRLLRVLRLLRLIRLLRYIGSASVMWDSFVSARKKLLLFFGAVMILLCLFGGLMYVIEGPENGFTSLPVAVYWAAVTITTVGYGDITPHTSLGRAVSTVLILLGYSLIAVPTGVMSSYMTDVMQRRRQLRSCTQCSQTGHDDGARYCKYCGELLQKDPD